MGVARGRPAARAGHAGHDRRGQAPARDGRPAQPLHQDPRHAPGAARDRGDDRRGHPGQRDADLLAPAPPRGGRGLPARHRAPGRDRRRPLAHRLRRVLLRVARGHGGGQAARRGRRARRAEGHARHRQRQARLPELPGDLRRRALGGAEGQGRHGAALPVGVDVHEEPGLSRRALRRGADRAGDGRHDAARDGRGLPGPRARRGDARARRGGRPQGARGVRRGGHRLRRRRGHAGARGRGEVRQVLRQAVRRRRGQARLDGAGMSDADRLRELGQQLRVDAVRSSAAAGSGHPTSSMSAADLMAVLLDGGYLRLDTDDLHNPANDHLIFSKGHASPLYYSVLKAAGIVEDEEFATFRKLGSRLEGHPTPRIPPTDVATGSLGQGLPIAVGVALAGKRLDRLPYRVWCLCGDSEMAEGSMWEAFEHASFAGLDNLTAIIDANRLGQTRETMVGWDLDRHKARAEAFGWHAITIDGHDVEAIAADYDEAIATTGRPTVIIAKTKKGKGVAAVEDLPGKHGKPLDDPDAAIEELGGERDLHVRLATPEEGLTTHVFETPGGELPTWKLGDKEATRKASGDAPPALGGMRGDVGALDGEVSNSTHSELFREAHEDRYFEMFIAEQQMAAAAVGMQVRGWDPFASTFAAFLSRAYDFVRMAAISRASIRLSGSHAGVSIGEDGPSQMALEDFASFRAIHGSCVLHPSDANQTAKLIAEMADRKGISYLRTLRGKTEVRTPADEDVKVGGSRLVREGDDVAIVACGITVDEAVEAAEQLEGEGVSARVIDAYSIKPIDETTIQTAARECGAIVTVEDHWPEGGLGDAVLDALAEADDRPPVVKLAVREMPTSGKPDELLHAAGIDAEGIIGAAKQVAKAGSPA